IYCDTGHNAEGMRMIVEQLKELPCETLYLILGMSNDKDVAPVLALLPKNAIYFFCEAQIPRAMPADLLYAKARKFGLNGEVVLEVNQALEKVLTVAGKNDCIFIGGSTFVVAELENL